MTSPVRLGVSPAATSTPMGVFNQWFKALFPHTETLGCAVCLRVLQLLPCQLATALTTQIHNLPPLSVRQPPPCCESSQPWLPVSPLLPVWMNVYFLAPWCWTSLSFDFLSALVGFFLFLNCCCPSFGCVRRHSVSTYASILARSPGLNFLTQNRQR